MQQGIYRRSKLLISLGILAILLLVLSSCRPSTKPPSACETNPNSVACQCEVNPQSEACICGTDSQSSECLCYDYYYRGGAQSRQCQCALDPTRCPTPPPETQQITCPNLPAEELVRQAITAVGLGDWGNARIYSDCAVDKDQYNTRAIIVKNQLDRGAEYFSETTSTPYTVQLGDNLGKIAGRCLASKNREEFIALAMYNNISNPGTLLPDTVIRIPGSRPCEDADSLIKKSDDALNSGDLRKAYEYALRAYKLSSSDDHLTRSKELLTALITSIHRDAQQQLEGGECTKARTLWREIQRLDKDDQQANYYLTNIQC